jgi:hypothetical protein
MKPSQLAMALLILAGCASQHQPTTAPALPPPPIAERMSNPPPTPEMTLPTWPPRVQAAIDHHRKTGEWSTYRLPSSVLYPFNENDQPLVACAPLRTTDIQLAAGETITDVAMGDSERWIATPASSGTNLLATPVIHHRERSCQHLHLGRSEPRKDFEPAESFEIALASGFQMIHKAHQEEAGLYSKCGDNRNGMLSK